MMNTGIEEDIRHRKQCNELYQHDKGEVYNIVKQSEPMRNTKRKSQVPASDGDRLVGIQFRHPSPFWQTWARQ